MFRLVRLLFGCCFHKRFSFPMDFNTTHHAALAGPLSSVHTYVCCLECGKEFQYDWDHMTLVEGNKRHGLVDLRPANASGSNSRPRRNSHRR